MTRRPSEWRDDEFRKKVSDHLESNWDLVTVIANALIERGRLDEVEFQALVEDAE